MMLAHMCLKLSHTELPNTGRHFGITVDDLLEMTEAFHDGPQSAIKQPPMVRGRTAVQGRLETSRDR